MTLHFLNDVNGIESTQKIYKYVIIASLNNESACILIYRILGEFPLISSYKALL